MPDDGYGTIAGPEQSRSAAAVTNTDGRRRALRLVALAATVVFAVATASTSRTVRDAAAAFTSSSSSSDPGDPGDVGHPRGKPTTTAPSLRPSISPAPSVSSAPTGPPVASTVSPSPAPALSGGGAWSATAFDDDDERPSGPSDVGETTDSSRPKPTHPRPTSPTLPPFPSASELLTLRVYKRTLFSTHARADAAFLERNVGIFTLYNYTYFAGADRAQDVGAGEDAGKYACAERIEVRSNSSTTDISESALRSSKVVCRGETVARRTALRIPPRLLPTRRRRRRLRRRPAATDLIGAQAEANNFQLHVFESFVTPTGFISTATWVEYWRELHSNFEVRGDCCRDEGTKCRENRIDHPPRSSNNDNER